MQSQSGDYAAIARDAAAAVSTAEQAGQRPAEADLLRLADAYQRSNNPAYNATLAKLLTYYPKKDYWAAYLARLPRKSGFADRYALDVMRLKLASGTMSSTDDFMEMAQLALQAGVPAEAKKIVERGFASGALGTGAEAERHQRLRALALKQDAESSAAIAARAAEAAAAKDGNALVQVGSVYVSMGEVDKGIALIEQGIAKGGLKRPEDAKLRLGLAQHAIGAGQGQGRPTRCAACRATTAAPTSRGCGSCWAMAELPPFASALGDGIWCIDTGYHRPHYDAAYLLVDRRPRRLLGHRHQLRGAAAAGHLAGTGSGTRCRRLGDPLARAPGPCRRRRAADAGTAQPRACCCTRAGCATWSTRRRCSRRCWRSTAPKRWRATTARCCRWRPSASPSPKTAWS